MNTQEKSLLIVKPTVPMSMERMAEMQDRINLGLKDLNVACVICNTESDVEFHQPISALVDAMTHQTQAINNLVASNIAILDEMVSPSEPEADAAETSSTL